MYERKKRPPNGKAETKKILPPPRTEEEEEKRACGLAMDLAVKWMEEGTAPSQIVVHFLKVASLKEQAELEKTRKEIKLLEIKAKSIEAADEQNQKYEKVLQAMRSYSGRDSEWETLPDNAPEDYVDYRP